MSKPPFEQENLRRLVEFAEGPMARQLRELDVAPSMKIADFLRQSGLLEPPASMIEHKKIFDALSASNQWAKFSDMLAKANATNPDAAAASRLIEEKLRSISIISDAVLPLADQLRTFTEAAALAIRPLPKDFANVEAWNSSLTDRLREFSTPWALEDHLGVSVTAFARIARLHDVSVGASPFDPESSAVLDEELGSPVEFDADADPEAREGASIDAGLNPELVAFPADVYPTVLVSAGFEVRIEAVRPIASEGGDRTGILDPQHSALLGQVENRLRTVIETELRRVDGDSWHRRIHGDVRRKWLDRQAKDRDQRGDAFELLFYSDFMELSDVICQKNNWDQAFQRFFFSKADFQTSMQRLAPVRNAIGHNRPLVRSDQITLFSEAFRILRALGVRIQ